MRKRQAVMLMFCLAGFAAADDARLGRLFLTPNERAALDSARQNNQPPQKIVEPGGKNNNAVVKPITVQGFVKRSDGKGTVWINGSPIQENSSTGAVAVGPLSADSDQVRITLSASGQSIRLKAGQRYDAASGKVGR